MRRALEAAAFIGVLWFWCWAVFHSDSVCAADKWTPENTALEIGYNLFALIDMRTTMDIRNHDNIEERGPAGLVLGRNPEPLPTVAYFVGTSVLHYGVSRALPRYWREGWQVVTIGVEGGYALNNVRLGLKWTW